jgi:integrase
MQERVTNRSKLTKRIVESATPDLSKRKLLWDTEIIGFCVRIYPTGRKTYFFQYRNQHNATKFIKLGVHGNATTEQAREKAKELAIRVSAGEDPSLQSLPKISGATMEKLADKYLNLHAKTNKRPKSIKEDHSMLKNYVLKEFRSRRVDKITTEEIQALHARLHKKQIRANRLLSLLHKMFKLAVQWKWRIDNPVSGIQRYQENKRTRWLQEDELKGLQTTLDAYPHQNVANIIRLLLLTGARKHEMMEATWDQFNFKKGVWTIQAHTTKQKKFEQYPLSAPALKILKSMKENAEGSPFLFPGRVQGKPLQDIKNAWASIKKQADIKDCTLHDLRHTYASHLVSSGLSLSIVGKLLGHTQASTTQRYAHLADESLREATALFGEKFQELNQK